MGRMLLALLVVVMLSLTGYVAYSTFGPTDGTATATQTEGCCSQNAPSCCSETTAQEASSCCQEKAACCETKGEAGTCCQGANKAKAIVGEKAEEPKAEVKKD